MKTLISESGGIAVIPNKGIEIEVRKPDGTTEKFVEKEEKVKEKVKEKKFPK